MIAQSALMELLEYDPETGNWIWIMGRNAGRYAGCTNTQGYNVIRIGSRPGKLYRCARLAFLYMIGRWPKDEVDHINGITGDDRWVNLRECTSQQNKQNRTVRYDNQLLIKGITQLPSGNFNAIIKHNYVSINLGTFKTLGEAVNARKVAERKYHNYAKNDEEAG